MSKAVSRTERRSRITVEMQPALKERLESAATSENRSLSNFVQRLLAKAVEPQREARAQ
jgi:hypothetical protein